MTPIRQTILETYAEVVESQSGSRPAPPEDDRVLLESGLDSLGFAILVTRLEEAFGFDPFVESDEAYYPVTFGDFIRFYEAHGARAG